MAEDFTSARPRTLSVTTHTTGKVDTAYWVCIGTRGKPE
jgi:hypothetical protein